MFCQYVKYVKVIVGVVKCTDLQSNTIKGVYCEKNVQSEKNFPATTKCFF